MDKFKKIAILRASGLGDFIFALPALSALKETFPKAEIIYLGKVWHQTFLSKRKSPVNRVIVIPPVAGVGMKEFYINDSHQLEKFFAKMQKEKFDLAIQMHGGGRHSNPFLLNLGAKLTIGTQTSDALPLNRTISYQYYQNEYLRWLEVVSLAGVKTAKIMPRLEATIEDIGETKEALGGNNQKLIILHPGAMDVRRRWPVERFAVVGDYFASLGFRIVVTGSGNEEDIVRTVIDQMEHSADNFYNKLSINGLAGLLSLSEIVISNDTGLLHLADALGRKTVGIYWCSNLIMAALPFREKSVCLSSWMVNCPFCNENRASFPFNQKKTNCKHETSFVAEVEVKEVIEAAENLLSS
ncbi:MAG: glycosyltransferase family 9 protein [Patescibacteria group bacterium]|nr:glycosyltransferase family 9 protein [Patescibacteria group bacterium]